MTSTLSPPAAVLEKLRSIGQECLIHTWDQLSPSQQHALATQIEALDSATFCRQRALWETDPYPAKEVEPWKDYSLAGSFEDRKRGQALLSQGRMGCVVLAGGQGYRLGAGRPKGTIPVLEGKSLFQLLAERMLAVGPNLPLAIMTSPGNHAETVRFFEEHDHFGLNTLSFFQQNVLPLLNQEGNLFLEAGRLATGPNGNGEVFHQFCASGLWEEWKKRGITHLSIVPIDNPLADPLDAELLGHADRCQAKLVVKAIFQREAGMPVGILGRRDGKMEVVEYSELKGKPPEGALASLSLYCVTMDHALAVSRKILSLHMVKRQGWKFETFIFDLWEEGSVLVYPKSACFAPLKRAEDLEKVQEALQSGICAQNLDQLRS